MESDTKRPGGAAHVVGRLASIGSLQTALNIHPNVSLGNNNNNNDDENYDDNDNYADGDEDDDDGEGHDNDDDEDDFDDDDKRDVYDDINDQ